MSSDWIRLFLDFVFLGTLLFELLDSSVWREVAFNIHCLESLDLLFGLQMVFPFL
jgi:hypothetical protein